MSQKNKPTETEIAEVLSFELYKFMSPDSKTYSRSQLEQNWREDAELRKTWRTVAGKLNDFLEVAGLSIKLHRSASLRKALTDLITIPAQPAYSLGNE